MAVEESEVEVTLNQTQKHPSAAGEVETNGLQTSNRRVTIYAENNFISHVLCGREFPLARLIKHNKILQIPY